MVNKKSPVLISFVGRSNSGKTTILTNLMPMFVNRGLKVGTIKNTHHNVAFDKPGKDSWRHSESGSSRVLVTSQSTLAVFEKIKKRKQVKELAQEWFQGFDVVISEGFKNDPSLKIEVYRSATGKSPLYKDPAFKINALVSDLKPTLKIPCFHFDEIDNLFQWLLQEIERFAD